MFVLIRLQKENQKKKKKGFTGPLLCTAASGNTVKMFNVECFNRHFDSFAYFRWHCEVQLSTRTHPGGKVRADVSTQLSFAFWNSAPNMPRYIKVNKQQKQISAALHYSIKLAGLIFLKLLFELLVVSTHQAQ